MMTPKMLDFYKRLLLSASFVGGIAKTTADDRYISIDISDGDTTYLLTVMTAKVGGEKNAD